MPDLDLTDADLLARMGNGNREAYAVLVARHDGLVQAACRRQAPSGMAEDCAQAVFLILARKPAAAARAPALAAWLLRTAWFVCDRARRTQRRRRHVALDSEALHTAHHAAPEALDHLDGCLLKLPEKQRAAVTLHYLAGKTPEEIAASLRTNRDNAYLLISRGLARLRVLLAQRGVAITGAGLVSVLAAEANAAAHATPSSVLANISGTPSADATALAHGAITSMFFTSLTPYLAAAGLVLAAGALSLALTAESMPPAPLPTQAAAGPTAVATASAPAPSADLSAIPAWGGTGFSRNFTLSPDGRWLVSDGIVFAMPDGRAVSLLSTQGKASTWKRTRDVPEDVLVDPANSWRTHTATLANLRQLGFSPDGRSLDGWHELLHLRFPVDGNGIGPGVAVMDIALPDVETIRSSINTVMTITEHGQSREVRIERGVLIGDGGGFDSVNMVVRSELRRLKQDGLVQKYRSGAWIWSVENARVWRTIEAGWSPLDLDFRPVHMVSDPSGQRMAVWHNGGINAVSIYTTEGTLIRRWVMEGRYAAAWSHLNWLPGDRILVSGAANGDDVVWWQLDPGASDDHMPPQTSGWPVTGPDGAPVGSWDGQTLRLQERSWTIALPSMPTWGKGTRPMTDAAGRWFIMGLGAGGLLVVDLTADKVCHPPAGVTLSRFDAKSQF